MTFRNIIWWACGGLKAAFAYLMLTILLTCTVIGIPFAMQTSKIVRLCLHPFDYNVHEVAENEYGILFTILNVIWFCFGGWIICFAHIMVGAGICLTIIGIPLGKQHFKIASFAIAPFGKELIEDTSEQ